MLRIRGEQFLHPFGEVRAQPSKSRHCRSVARASDSERMGDGRVGGNPDRSPSVPPKETGGWDLSQPPDFTGSPGMTRTCDPVINSHSINPQTGLWLLDISLICACLPSVDDRRKPHLRDSGVTVRRSA